MPEGPEHHINARNINQYCGAKIVFKKIAITPPNKHADIVITKGMASDGFNISAKARGKEIMLTPKCCSDSQDNINVVFQFGMTGHFELYKCADDTVPKYCRLYFSTADGSEKLCFIDIRRFGSWKISDSFSSDRGPDPYSDSDEFKNHVKESLDASVFSHALCEVMHNQKYFNGVGNYLRAEIIHRAQVKPFDIAREVLSGDKGDLLLDLCGKVMAEVLALSKTKYSTYFVEGSNGSIATADDEDESSEFTEFVNWCQCYSKPGMKYVQDKNKRTMWFSGDPGKLKPPNPIETKTAEGKVKQQAVEKLVPEEEVKSKTKSPVAQRGKRSSKQTAETQTKKQKGKAIVPSKKRTRKSQT